MKRKIITRVWLPGYYKESGRCLRSYMMAPEMLGAQPLFGFTQRDGTNCYFWKLTDEEYLVTYEDYLLMEKVNDDYIRIPFTRKELKIIKKINTVTKEYLDDVIRSYGWYKDKIQGSSNKYINLYDLYNIRYDGWYDNQLPQPTFDLIEVSNLKYYLKEE